MYRYLLPLIILVLPLFSGNAFAYTYDDTTDDRIVTVFKTAVSAAKAGNWMLVAGLAKTGLKLQKNHIFPADHLVPLIRESLSERNVSKAAEFFASLVFLSIRDKLHQNRKENFSNYKNAKARLLLARKSYIDVLDGNVKKRVPSRSSLLLDNFKIALNSIGNPGLLGVGEKAPDPEAYDRAVKAIEELIFKTFPGFVKDQ